MVFFLVTYAYSWREISVKMFSNCFTYLPMLMFSTLLVILNFTGDDEQIKSYNA